jgi:hypothetical protein
MDEITYNKYMNLSSEAIEQCSNKERESLFYLLQIKKHNPLVQEISETIEEIKESVKYGSPSEVVQWKQTAYDFFGRK